MRRFASHHAMGALALILTLSGCGGGKQAENAALASLDTRLTGNIVDDNAAAPAEVVKPNAPSSRTLGTLAQTQRSAPVREPVVQRIASAAGRPVGGCAGRGMTYGDQWAQAMPEGLGLYPGARLVEAAGTDTGRCALRVISFTTSDSAESVVTHYAAQVRRAGFDAERQPCATEIRLGGVRGDAAYMLFARRRNGVTEVDIVASAGTRT